MGSIIFKGYSLIKAFWKIWVWGPSMGECSPGVRDLGVRALDLLETPTQPSSSISVGKRVFEPGKILRRMLGTLG